MKSGWFLPGQPGQLITLLSRTGDKYPGNRALPETGWGKTAGSRSLDLPGEIE